MNIKHIQKAALGKWQYRCRRFPESIKAALGRNDFKRVLKARSEAEVLREYPRIEAEFDHIVEGASVTKAVAEGDVSRASHLQSGPYPAALK
ncbi:hypothetical protein [Cypionkella sp. TWP1-2-1b2]|uniref:hypothetical protein n=1 Tax=Cypionkella sp. TWP1-2-1b2 TaxID=2804675 RepID=UPI003CEC98A9